MTGSIRLEVLVPVSNVVVTPNTTDLEEFKDSVRLSCSSSGSSRSFLWLNSSSEVTASDRVQLTDGNSSLTIVSGTRYDQGPFRCHVSNPVSSATSGSILLSISSDSRPAALFYWFLNGDKLSDTGPELKLMNIQMSQSGNYSCQAFNEKTLRYETSQSSVVSVLERVLPPVVTVSNTDLEEFKDSVRLSCSSSGSSPSFLWLNNNTEVTASDRVQLTDGDSTLTIVSVTRYDQGPFMCHVTNPVSNGNSDPVNLLVIYGPENINLTLSPSQEYYDEGSDVSLICSVASGPVPVFKWFLNGDLLSDIWPS
uniref:Carcinoembryonic antigen-related cell adhesion molecule 5 n=1 Tax=Larimichthys crocea TaxID=215358 RepID=A0A0F8B0J0_LARCR